MSQIPRQIRADLDRAAALAASKASQAQAKRENATHTPGPWVVHPTAHHPAVRSVGTSDTGPRRICTVGSMNGNPVDKKNARLIAAAPELLAALQFVMAASGEQLSTAFEQAQAAIAKATGDTE